MKPPIRRYEHQKLLIGEDGFTSSHWKSLLKLNQSNESKYFEILHNGIKFQQYVGIIQVGELAIEIHPKADKHEEDQKWKGVLLQMLQACGKLRAETYGAANVRRQHLNLLEVYFEIFLTEVNDLIRKGLIKQYRYQTKNVTSLKGKLEFAGNIRLNVIHKERFYTRHQVYDVDHKIHQVLAQALRLVEQFTRGSRIYDLVGRTILSFPEVEYKVFDAKQLDSIDLNRKSEPYCYALELARLIILNYSPDISSGRQKMLSLLFDMNELWEEYVLVQLRKACRGTDLEVTGQESKTFWGSNGLRPDIVIRQGHETYVIDTKWKTPGSSSASIQDLRQMYAYARFWNAEKVMLLYPGSRDRKRFQSFENEDYSFPNSDGTPELIDHRCKMAFAEIVDQGTNMLSSNVGTEILAMLNTNVSQSMDLFDQ